MIRKLPIYLAGIALVCACITDVGGKTLFALPMVMSIIAVVVNWDSIPKAPLRF